MKKKKKTKKLKKIIRRKNKLFNGGERETYTEIRDVVYQVWKISKNDSFRNKSKKLRKTFNFI